MYVTYRPTLPVRNDSVDTVLGCGGSWFLALDAGGGCPLIRVTVTVFYQDMRGTHITIE